MNPVISVKNLKKSFGDKKVIKDLSFDVLPGEIFAFLGANGSGKTTTIRCLLNIFSPDSGDLRIFGERYSTRIAERIGYLPEERGLYATSKVLETMTYFGTLKGLNAFEARIKSEEYLESIEMSDKKDSKINKLSSGQQQKIQLGITFINNPELLILDEPTRGLDPMNRDFLMKMLAEMNKNGTTIIFITHLMDEVEKIANRLVMIKDGERVLYGDVEDVKESFGDNVIHIIYKGSLKENDDLFTCKKDTNYASLIPKKNVTADQILKYLVKTNIQLKKFEVSSPSLQEIFVKVSKENYEK